MKFYIFRAEDVSVSITISVSFSRTIFQVIGEKKKEEQKKKRRRRRANTHEAMRVR
jgi:hypothetical protein